MNIPEYRAMAHKLANRRRKGTPHKDLIKAIVQRLVLMRGVVVIQHNTGALAVGEGQQRRFVRFGYPGMADLYVRARCVTPEFVWWRTVWLEVKVPPDVQSTAQVEFERMVVEWGDIYRVVRSVEDAERAVAGLP